MKLYKLTFNKYESDIFQNSISCNKKIEPHSITVQKGTLFVAVNKVSELEWLDQYGSGIKVAEYLGGILILDEKPIFEKEE